MSIVITYPDVPFALGVPAVPRQPGAALPADIVPMTADTYGGSGQQQAESKWGIFDQSGNRVLEPDSMIGLDYKSDSITVKYPIEQGSFSNYNKVETPQDIKLLMTKGGSDADRSAFMTALDTAKKSLDLYQVTSPDYYYDDMNIVHVSYRRDARNGVTLLTAEVWLEEIRQSATSEFTQTQSPSGSDPVNGGTVQPTPAPAAAKTSMLYEMFT